MLIIYTMTFRHHTGVKYVGINHGYFPNFLEFLSHPCSSDFSYCIPKPNM